MKSNWIFAQTDVVAHFKMNNKILIISILLIILTSCENSSKKTEESNNFKSENFDDFYKKFYSDSIFQKGRIIRPLKGKILEWHELKDSVVESNWNNRKLEFISDLKTNRPSIENSDWTIIQSQESKIEKIFIKNSGFFIEREFKQKDGKWYLFRYDISNL